MTKDEALKLALDFIENSEGGTADLEAHIKEALAQPEHGWTPERIAGMARLKEAQDKKMAQPEQEPVAWRAWVSKFPQGTGSDWVYVTKPIMKDSVHNQPLYTTPPQRTWVGLTDENFLEACQIAERGNYLVAFQRIQAKLKEKNT